MAVTSVSDAMRLLARGDRQRKVASTAMNAKSSRSHALFKMIVESRMVASSTGACSGDDAASGGLCAPDGSPSSPLHRPVATKSAKLLTGWHDKVPVKVAHLNLVDLAGSERASKATTSGQQLKEGALINKSLLTLGIVIAALAKPADRRAAHVPYRDSKLTRLLASSLGGNSKTAVIATVSPAAFNIEETRSTLMFASRATRVVNQPLVNEVTDQSALLEQYRIEISSLKERLGQEHRQLEAEAERTRKLEIKLQAAGGADPAALSPPHGPASPEAASPTGVRLAVCAFVPLKSFFNVLVGSLLFCGGIPPNTRRCQG